MTKYRAAIAAKKSGFNSSSSLSPIINDSEAVQSGWVVNKKFRFDSVHEEEGEAIHDGEREKDQEGERETVQEGEGQTVQEGESENQFVIVGTIRIP